MAEIDPEDGFLTRWSRRKAHVRQGQPVPAAAPLPVAPTAPPAPPEASAAPRPAEPGLAEAAAPEPQPTLDDVAQLTPTSDFRRFVAPQVGADVRNAALKRLFADPHFNVMDGLDTYIEDFGKADPLAPGMLRKMAQAEWLNLFADEPKGAVAAPAAAASSQSPEAPDDEDPALRLQPHDAAGAPGAEPGAGEDTGRQR
jgi:hypothetical protein